MKSLYRYLLCIIILFMLQSILGLPVMAHGFQTNPVASDQYENILKNIELELLDQEIGCSSIECFDVHKDGRYAIGFSSNNKRIIQIYDDNGNYQTGYSFMPNGHYTFAFDGENLEVYCVRSNLLWIINAHGECASIRNVPLTEYNSAIIDERIYSTEKSVGAYTYFLDRDRGIKVRDYSRLVRVDAEGNEKVLYDVTLRHNIRVLVSAFFIGVFVICNVVLVTKQTIDYYKQHPDE